VNFPFLKVVRQLGLIPETAVLFIKAVKVVLKLGLIPETAVLVHPGPDN
jgi:hypothetical protein